jgi:hypothetical protein
MLCRKWEVFNRQEDRGRVTMTECRSGPPVLPVVGAALVWPPSGNHKGCPYMLPSARPMAASATGAMSA